MSATLINLATTMLTMHDAGFTAWLNSLGTAAQNDRAQHRHIERAARLAARRIQGRYETATLAAIQRAIGRAADSRYDQSRSAGCSVTGRR